MWELTGHVIVKPTEDDAEELDVSVSDQECKSWSTFGTLQVFWSCVWGLIVFSTVYACDIYAHQLHEAGLQHYLPLALRGAAWQLHTFTWVMGSGTSLFAVNFTGYDTTWKQRFVIGSMAAVAHFMGQILKLNNFLSTVMEFGPIFVGSVVWNWMRTRHLGTRYFATQFKIGVCISLVTYGAWSSYFVVGFMFVRLAAVHALLANLWLTFGTSMVEIFMVALTSKAYISLVYEKRCSGKQPPLGDFRETVCTGCVGLAFCCSEMTRLVSIMASEARMDSYLEEMGQERGLWDRTWLLSVVLNVASNASRRLMWTNFIGIKLCRLMGVPKTGMELLSVWSIDLIYNRCKFALGYPRFVLPFAVAIGRFIVFQEMTIPALFISYEVFLVVVVSWFAEILEDYMVAKLPTMPVTSDIIEYYESFDSKDPRQVLAMEAVSVFSTDPWRMSELDEHGQRGFSAWDSSSHKEGGEEPPQLARKAALDAATKPESVAHALGQKREVSYTSSLWCTRSLSCATSVAIILSSINLGSILYDLLLGPGYVRDSCRLPCNASCIYQAHSWDLPHTCG